MKQLAIKRKICKVQFGEKIILIDLLKLNQSRLDLGSMKQLKVNSFLKNRSRLSLSLGQLEHFLTL